MTGPTEPTTGNPTVLTVVYGLHTPGVAESPLLSRDDTGQIVVDLLGLNPPAYDPDPADTHADRGQ